jgi:hypothetical protein
MSAISEFRSLVCDHFFIHGCGFVPDNFMPEDVEKAISETDPKSCSRSNGQESALMLKATVVTMFGKERSVFIFHVLSFRTATEALLHREKAVAIFLAGNFEDFRVKIIDV